MKTVTASAFALCCVLAAIVINQAQAMSGKPYKPECAPAITVGQYDRVQCEFDEEPYIARAGQTIPMSFVLPKGGEKLKIVVNLHGYTAFPVYGESAEGHAPGILLINHNESYSPNHNDFREGVSLPMPWWGPLAGKNSAGYRICESLDTAYELYGKDGTNQIDLAAGITLQGNSAGGTGSILQSVLMDCGYRALITTVKPRQAHTLFVKPNEGQYYKDTNVQLAWNDFDPERANIQTAMKEGRVNHVFYDVQGLTNDHLGITDLDFFRDCDKYKIDCRGEWAEGTHSEYINRPNLCKGFVSRLNLPKVIFTEFSGNRWTPNGHYNRGLCSLPIPGNYINTPTKFLAPISYVATKDLPMIAPQADVEDFKVTVRGAKLPMPVGACFDYLFGPLSGIACVEKEGEITTPTLTLPNSKISRGLQLTPAYTLEPTVAAPVLVYTQSVAHNDPIPGTDYPSAGSWDNAVDVGRFRGGFAESDTVVEYSDGRWERIHNCTTDNTMDCAAEDVRVSPNGQWAAYWVGNGDGRLDDVYIRDSVPRTKVPGAKNIRYVESCDIWLYHFTSKKSYLATNNGPSKNCDRNPDWIDNETLVLASDREGTYPSWTPAGTPTGSKYYTDKSAHIHSAKIVDNRLQDFVNLTPHECNAVSPMVHTSGDIWYSSFMGCGVRGSLSTSPRNQWYVKRICQYGNCSFAEHGFHRMDKGPYLKTHQDIPNIDPRYKGTPESAKVLRPVAQLTAPSEGKPAKMAVVSYYRNTKVGGHGSIHCLDDLPGEGVLTAAEVLGTYNKSTVPGSGHFAPSTLEVCTPFANSQDERPRKLLYTDASGVEKSRVVGIAGGAAPHTEAVFMFTWAKGNSYDVSEPFTNEEWLDGQPSSHRVLALALTPRITDPFDTEQVKVISSNNAFHRYNGQQVTTYREKFGQDTPTRQEPLDPTATTQMVVENMFLMGTVPIPGKTDALSRAAMQGNVVDDYAVQAMDGGEFCAKYLKANKTLPTKFEHDYEETVCAKPNNKGCVVLPIEPDRLFEMLVKRGDKILGHDVLVHSLRKGETRTCAGCHFEHDEPSAIARIASGRALPTDCE